MNTPLTYQHKIVDRAQLVTAVERARRRGRKIVHCHGCFDIVHPGHIRYLEFARRQGDVLVVSLTGDSNIAKGAGRPFIPQELRAENLAALGCVDLVYVDPHATAEHVLEDVKPDVYVKGREYDNSADPRFLSEKRTVERHGGRVLFSSGEIVFSSSRLVGSIGHDPEIEVQRCAVIAARHGLDHESLTAVVERFRSARVLVVGDTVLDRYRFCDALDVAHESPMLSLRCLDEKTYVGGAAIVARHAAALGAQAALLTAAAADEQSAAIERQLDEEGIESHLIRCRPSLVEKTRYLVDEKKLLKVEVADRVPLDSLAERRATGVLEQCADGVDAVILCDFGFGMLTSGFLARVLPDLRQRVGVITGDVSGPRGNLFNFADANLLCPTERELRANLNDYESGLSSAAHQLLCRTQARHLIVTLEKKGLVVFDRPAQDPTSREWTGRLVSEHLPTFNERPIDKLGGGDALLATASLAMACGASLMHAAYLGNAAAALEIGTLGNVPLDAQSLCLLIAGRAELSAAPTAQEPVTAGV